jgi:hypothetical protein
MITQEQALKKFGRPDDVHNEARCMTFYHPPAGIPAIPRRIYCNRELVKPLDAALKEIELRGMANLIKTWDGCFAIRPIRGTTGTWSMHSWGLAFDINAKTNGLGQEPTMPPQLVEVFKRHGFEWGGDFKRKDGMHFELAKL